MAALPVEVQEAFASASGTYLSGHKRFDFLHVEIVTGVPRRKELANHTETPHSWPRHREAIVSDHVTRPGMLGSVVFRLPLTSAVEDRGQSRYYISQEAKQPRRFN